MTPLTSSTVKKRSLGRSLSLTSSLPTWLRGKSSNDVGGAGQQPFQRMPLMPMTSLDLESKKQPENQSTAEGNNKIWTVDLPSNEW